VGLFRVWSDKFAPRLGWGDYYRKRGVAADKTRCAYITERVCIVLKGTICVWKGVLY
jgi:hypothetical protein